MKKIKLLALTLAFCLIASVIPAPVAVAADTDFPKVVDLIYSYTDAAETVVTSGKLYSTDTNLPTVEANGFAIDFTTAVLVNNYVDFNAAGISPRIHGTGGKITINVKAPVAGNYIVFLKARAGNNSLGQNDFTAQVGSGATVNVDADTVATAKIGEITVAENESSIEIKIVNAVTSNSSLYLGSFVFVPVVDVVYAEFTDGTWRQKAALATTFSYLEYEKNGLEVLNYSIKGWTNAQTNADNLYFRTVPEDYITFGVFVPKDGIYTGVVNALRMKDYGGVLSVYVDGTKVGTITSYTEDTSLHKYTDFNFDDSVELTTGLHEIMFVCDENTDGKSSVYNRLAYVKLTRTGDIPQPVEITNADIFGDVSAYITKDGTFTAFSGIESLDYNAVGFVITYGGETYTVVAADNKVYKTVTVNVDGVDTPETVEVADFNLTGDNAHVFFASQKLGTSISGEVTFTPYAVKGDKTITGYTYKVTL